MFRLLSGLLMGWSLGANDSANIFGTAVFARMVRFRTAALLTSFFLLLGALLQGAHGMHTLSGLVEQTMNSAFISALAAGITVTLMTILHLPVSTSQAMVGSIIGIGIVMEKVNLAGMPKIVIAWVGTPVGCILLTIILYPLLSRLISLCKLNIFQRDSLLRWGLIIVGCYGAYALGANNVANVTGIYTETGLLTIREALLLGGCSIALGTITFSKRVMQTIGEKLVRLDPFGALVAVLSHSIILNIYAEIGVPVSSSQAIVGGVLGIGFVKGMKTINIKTLLGIVIGWFSTPIAAMIISAFLYFVVSRFIAP